ncbi:MAG: site-2 protease family protein [Chloroflexota bacterium]|nr:site-2 protease family protein [Chloroflexota bacterium]
MRLSWDLLLILALPVVGALTKGRPYGEEGSAAAVWAVVAGAIGVAFIGSVAAHEFAHAFAARRVGLPVRWVKLSLLGGAAEISAERSTPVDECLVAIAGPGISLALALATGLIALVSHGRYGPLFALFIALAIMNGLLVVLNLLPGFPLDGGRIVRAFAWYVADDLMQGTRVAAGYGQVLSWSLLALGGVATFYSPVFGLWIILIGYYIGRAGRLSFVQLLWQETSQDIPLVAITGPGPLLAPDKLIGDVVDLFLSDRLSGPRPVGADGVVMGVLDLDTNVRKVPRPLWLETTVRDAMTPINALPTLTLAPQLTLHDGLRLLERTDARTIAVINETGAVVGIVTRERVDRWVRSRLRETGFRVKKPPRQPF